MNIIKWTNKFSGETGYVKSLRKAKGCFINTFDKEEARRFSGQKRTDDALQVLDEIGETKNNIFEVEVVEK